MSRKIKFRAWDGKRLTTSGIMFNCSTGQIDVPVGSQMKLMQFTGLTDKNGKEIYEGDVVEAPSGRFVIDVSNTAFIRRCVFITMDDGRKVTNPLNTIHTLYETQNFQVCEVIGNIYDNPELIINPSTPITEKNPQ